MVSKYLQEKIERSYDALRLGAKISATYYHAPLVITYSGGKDSDAILKLARECLGRDDFEVINSHTTVDAPPTVYHIREVFKGLQEDGIKTTIKNLPTKDQTQITMWDLYVKKKMLPTRTVRFCCKVLKEASTPHRIIATGVRSSESIKRRGRDVFSTCGKTKADALHFSLDHVREVFNEAVEDAKLQGVPLDTASPLDCTFIRQAKEKKSEIIQPIYDWSTTEVWEYIRDRDLPYCKLYDMGYSRVGCVGCPLSGPKEMTRDFTNFPQYKAAYLNVAKKILDILHAQGKHLRVIETPEEYLDWWINGKDRQMRGQMTIEQWMTEMEDKE